MITPRRTIMIIEYDARASRWVTGCTRCWWRGSKRLFNEQAARHAAAQHLWNARHQPHQPRTCDHPEKRHHLTVEGARRHIVDLYKRGRGNPDYRPYRCAGPDGCGWYHVGHDRKNLQHRIRTAVRR